VNEPDELASAFTRARSEAGQAFGDPRVYLERFLDRPRHIEIQVLADRHGNAVHLGERECSIQRRHQKLIEEAPSPVVDAELRDRMGLVALEAVRAVGYESAGTVEFLYAEGEFFFLEMNTRLQVEHPVTEMVTGVDIVREQIRLAAGEPLGWEPDPEWPIGHSIECRISGEDPVNGFLPSVGRIRELEPPGGPGVRWDSGVSTGFDVGPHYDPLLAKLIVHAGDRDQAISRMRRALLELHVAGVYTTQPFHLAVMGEADFHEGRISIRYVEDHPELLAGMAEELLDAATIAAVLLEEERHGAPVIPVRPLGPTRDGRLSGWQWAVRPGAADWKAGP